MIIAMFYSDTGGVGLNSVQGAALSGARQVIAVDLLPNKLAAARQFGASDLINAAEVDPVEAVKEVTDGRMADYVFVPVGSARAVNPALASSTSGLPDPLAPVFALTPAGMLAGASAMAGQIWPVWLKFHGGRGAATALGITGAALPAAVLIMALPCISVLLLTRSTIIALPFIYLTSMVLARAVLGVGWGAIGYCLGIFIAVGAVHFWAVRSRRPASGATPGADS